MHGLHRSKKTSNLSVQWKARAEPLWQVDVKSNIFHFYKVCVEAMAAPDFGVRAGDIFNLTTTN